MRTGQLQALSNTRHVKGQPFDAIDLSFAVLTAISGHPIAFLLTGAQYFARRSALVAETLLDAIDLPPRIADSRLVRGVLPGATKLLPMNTLDDQALDNAQATLEAPAANEMLSIEQWHAALSESPHLLIYGPSKAGKSTLAQAIVSMFSGCDYVVLDPQPNKLGESKWGGIDFITLDEQGDEYASIKAALERIKAEDYQRRRTMRRQTHKPLVVIVDEVLALVGALGMITNEEGKKEPRMAHFIRTMGYSARHRNIKIILIGQGKNLADLGLSSATARNNYALVRAARNAATNQRSAYIETDEGEKSIDLRHVKALAGAAAARAQVWLKHADLASASDSKKNSESAELLSTLLGLGSTVQNSTSTSNNLARHDNNVPAAGNTTTDTVTAYTSGVSAVTNVSVTAQEAAMIALLLAGNKAPSLIARELPGYTPRNYMAYKAKVDRVAAMLAAELGKLEAQE